MEYFLPSAFLFLLLLVLLLNLLTLPANWVMVGLVFLWRLLNPNPGTMDIWYFILVIGLAVLGEIIEYVAQAYGSKKYGSTTSGMFAGIVGAIIGAVVGVAFLFGFGALIGALIGGFFGCYIMEKINGRDDKEALKAAKGAMLGRFLGIVVKCAIGAVILILTYNAIWPSLVPAPALPISNL